MPNDNRQMGVTHQRAILYELKLINEKLEKMIRRQANLDSYDPNHGTCCRNGCEKCEQ